MNKFNRNELGRIGSTTHWTKSAIFCYERNCICTNCPMNGMLESQKCKMKASVLELMRVFGKPNKTAQF